MVHLSMSSVDVINDGLYCSIMYGLNILQSIQNENKSLKKSLKVKFTSSSWVLSKVHGSLLWE